MYSYNCIKLEEVAEFNFGSGGAPIRTGDPSSVLLSGLGCQDKRLRRVTVNLRKSPSYITLSELDGSCTLRSFHVSQASTVVMFLQPFHLPDAPVLAELLAHTLDPMVHLESLPDKATQVRGLGIPAAQDCSKPAPGRD